MQYKLLAASRSRATTLIGVNAPLPLIDLDKITAIVADTSDNMAAVNGEKQFNDSLLAEPLEAFVRLLRKKHKHRILDISCGRGWEASFLTARGFNVVGIDASTEMVQEARTHISHTEFQKMNMQDLQFAPEEAFDAIWSTRTLIHTPETLTIDLLASWKRVLKPGGILGIGVKVGERNGWETAQDGTERSMFYHYFTDGELEQALVAAGYEIVEKPQIKNECNEDGSRNFFVFAQRADTKLDRAAYLHYAHYDEHEKRWIVNPEDLSQVISLFLRAGSLTSREQVNLCLFYDQLANVDRPVEDRYKLAAQKLKLHLLTPETCEAEDFDVWFAMGELQLKLIQFPQAISCLELAHRLRPDHFASLLRLSYSYEGISDFDQAIATAQAAEQMAEHVDVSDEERADLYHALGHFYVSRSLSESSETSIEDREKGDRYMERACSTGKNGHIYLSCLASLYNQTKRYSDTIALFDNIIENEKIRTNEELENELNFYRAEACIGTDRYAFAQTYLDLVERYANAKHDWDALAHVKLYQVYIELKRKDVGELSLDDIRNYLSVLYAHQPSPYVVEPFKREQDNVISILSAFYLINQCVSVQEAVHDFDEFLAGAIYYFEQMYERGVERDLNLLVLADDPSAVPGELHQVNCRKRLLGFDEVETDISEREMKNYRVWAVLALKGAVQASTLSSLTYSIGRFYREGYTIYIYDPKEVFPKIIGRFMPNFFVQSVEEIAQFTYLNMLYDEAREYLDKTKSSLGLAPIGIAPSRMIAQAENIDLLPLEGEES